MKSRKISAFDGDVRYFFVQIITLPSNHHGDRLYYLFFSVPLASEVEEDELLCAEDVVSLDVFSFSLPLEEEELLSSPSLHI